MGRRAVCVCICLRLRLCLHLCRLCLPSRRRGAWAIEDRRETSRDPSPSRVESRDGSGRTGCCCCSFFLEGLGGVCHWSVCRSTDDLHCELRLMRAPTLPARAQGACVLEASTIGFCDSASEKQEAECKPNRSLGDRFCFSLGCLLGCIVGAAGADDRARECVRCVLCAVHDMCGQTEARLRSCASVSFVHRADDARGDTIRYDAIRYDTITVVWFVYMYLIHGCAVRRQRSDTYGGAWRCRPALTRERSGDAPGRDGPKRVAGPESPPRLRARAHHAREPDRASEPAASASVSVSEQAVQTHAVEQEREPRGLKQGIAGVHRRAGPARPCAGVLGIVILYLPCGPDGWVSTMRDRGLGLWIRVGTNVVCR